MQAHKHTQFSCLWEEICGHSDQAGENEIKQLAVSGKVQFDVTLGPLTDLRTYYHLNTNLMRNETAFGNTD